MKQKVAKIVSATVMTVAQKTSGTACNWRTYQPKVPQKLLEKK